MVTEPGAVATALNLQNAGLQTQRQLAARDASVPNVDQSLEWVSA